MEERLSPEKLLEQIKREEKKEERKGRGKLKVFLGFAAGVGKTYAMLEAAHGLKVQGIDVVCGYIEPHSRPDTTALTEGLEQISPLMVEYKGIKLREFDLDASLERHPQLLLVDELAHTNAQGCRHQKRYQDIEELLQAGINVFTTVNIQHLESLNDLVSSITKITVRERIPDSVFDQADQVEIVDIEPDDLIERLKEGKIYKESQALRAMDHFFAKEKLIALREIALRRMADRVTMIAQEERPSDEREYFVGEHILTCISASPTSAKVIRTASRLAYAFHGQFTALYVETPAMQAADRKVKKMLEDNMQLARDLGAKIASVYGEDVPFQIAEYARASNVSKIVIGRTNHKTHIGHTKGTFVDRLTQYAPGLDVYVIPDVSPTYRKKRTFKRESVDFYEAIQMFGIMAACTVVGYGFKKWDLPDSNVIMIYILGVILSGVYTNGRILSVASSILSVILYNFFFTIPYYSLHAYGKSYPVTFLVMLIVALFTSSMMGRLRRQTKASAKMAYRTELLLETNRRISRAKTAEDVLNEIAGQTVKLMNLPVVIYLKQNDKMVGPYLYPKQDMDKKEMKEYTDSSERAVAQWVFEHHHRAGTCTSTLPGAKALYLPMQDNEKVFAVMGIVLEERREIPPFEYGLLSAMLNEAALMLEKVMK